MFFVVGMCMESNCLVVKIFKIGKLQAQEYPHEYYLRNVKLLETNEVLSAFLNPNLAHNTQDIGAWSVTDRGTYP